MKLKSGDLKHYIKIVKPVEGSADVYGRRTVTWTEFAAVYAKVSDVSGRDFFAAAAYQQQNVVTFSFRSIPVKENMRIEYGGVTYDIIQINHLGYRGDFVTVHAKAVEAVG